MPVDLVKIISKVTSKVAPSLLVDVSTTDGRATTDSCGSYGSCGGTLCGAAFGALDVLVFLSDALGIGFPIPGGLSQLIMNNSPGKRLGGDGVSMKVSVMVSMTV